MCLVFVKDDEDVAFVFEDEVDADLACETNIEAIVYIY
jgi:hypothetical protein